MTADLRAAGGAALDVNAPASPERVADHVGWLAAAGPSTAVDLGCGRGALAVALAVAAPSARVTGVDLDPTALAAARDRAAAAGVGDRCAFVEQDAAEHAAARAADGGAYGALACVASGHALGGWEGLLDRALWLVAPGGVAVLGDGVWATSPDAWCLQTFGELPRRDDVTEAALQLGWAVEDVDGSTLEEWDAFEAGWAAGVEAVGTEEARSFAAARREEYARYRGVLGFTWLRLRRPA